MINEPQHRITGNPISDWIAGAIPDYLADIGMGMATIIQTGRRDYGLQGPPLIEFVRRALYALIQHGAVPRHWGSPSDPFRDYPLHYGGDTPQEIVEGVIADWLAAGAGDLEWGDFWFARPGTLKGR